MLTLDTENAGQTPGKNATHLHAMQINKKCINSPTRINSELRQ
jgi:hypothetical protein